MVATCSSLTPTSKFIATKYNWFRQHVEDIFFRILKVESLENIADLFTKCLTPAKFLPLRQKLCGF